MKQINNTLRCLFSLGALSAVFVAGAQNTAKDFSQVELDEVAQSYVLSADELLRAEAGVTVTSTDGSPFAKLTTLIRGVNAIRGNSDPLWIIDGVMLNSSSLETEDLLWTSDNDYTSSLNALATINPSDIVSIQVLKDLQATAIYGARGANGVVIVTTKAGKLTRGNGLEIKYQGNISLSLVDDSKAPEMLSLSDFKSFQQTLGNNSYDSLTGDTNIADNAFHSAISTNHNFSLAGADGGQRYLISLNYRDIDGVMDRSEGNTGGLRINYSNQVGTFLNYGSRTMLSYASYNAPKTTNTFGDQSMTTLLTTGVPATDYTSESSASWASDFDDQNDEYRAMQNLFANITIVKGLTLNMNLGADYRLKKRFMWMGDGTPIGLENSGVVSMSTLEAMQYNFDSALAYTTNIEGHNISATLGTEIFGNHQVYNTAVGYGFFSYDLRAKGLSWADVQDPIHLYRLNSLSNAFSAAVSYNYQGRYGVEASMRADNNSRFDQGEYIFYPSVGAYWDVKNEEFMKNVSWLSALKFSAGYGQAGNESSFHYDMFDNYIGSHAYYPEVDDTLSIYYAGLHRTNSREYNAKMNLGLFDNRFQAQVGVYQKETTDGLYLFSEGLSDEVDEYGAYVGDWYPVDAMLGFVNETTFESRGVEFSLYGNLVSTNDFSWDVALSGAFTDNEVLSASYADKYGQDIASGVSATANIAGGYVNSFYGLTAEGIVTADNIADAPTYGGVAAELGDVLYTDISGDGDIDGDDIALIGKSNPSFTGSFSTSIRYKKFTASLLINGVYGNDILNLNKLMQENVSGSNNVSYEAYSNAYPATNDYPAIGAKGVGVISDKYVEDGSYVRLQNVTVGYDFDLKSNVIKSLNLNLTMTNLFTLTSYSGWSPDVNSYSSTVSTYGIDYGSYPSSSSIILGVKLTF